MVCTVCMVLRRKISGKLTPTTFTIFARLAAYPESRRRGSRIATTMPIRHISDSQDVYMLFKFQSEIDFFMNVRTVGLNILSLGYGFEKLAFRRVYWWNK